MNIIEVSVISILLVYLNWFPNISEVMVKSLGLICDSNVSKLL